MCAPFGRIVAWRLNYDYLVRLIAVGNYETSIFGGQNIIESLYLIKFHAMNGMYDATL